jgi:hypothetical protein
MTHPAEEYVRAGFALCSIPRGSKGPRTKGWNQKANAITTIARAAKLNGHNIGLLHEFSGTCALDVDDLAKATKALAAEGIDLDALLADPKAVQIVSGKPNRAKLLYRLPKGVKPLAHRKLADGALELRCAGVQDVLPPSIHPDTGKPYTWKGDYQKLRVLPKEVLALWNRQGGKGKAVKTVLVDDEIVYALKARDLYREDAGGGKHRIACPWAAEHTTDGGAGETAYFMPHTNGYDRPAFKCFHSHCARRTFTDLRVYLGLEQAVEPGEELLMQRRYTLAELLADAVYLAGLDRITLLSAPWVECSPEHFGRYTAASTETVNTNNGPRKKCVATLWLEHPNRKTVTGRTFAPGADTLCPDPDGKFAVNTWREVPHTPPKDWKKRAALFVEHLAYLIPEREYREQVLLWFAHIVQRPGDMPPWHVLMYTEGAQGVGRNWLAAVIGAVVRPYAALHVDISALAGHAHGVGFNGSLAGKLFACVDELHASAFAAGGRRMMETLKVTLTAETRLLNPKYGRQTVEFNRLRVLILSNHRDAMPLDGEDRRFLVVRNPDQPKPAAYYTKLYGLLTDPEFIAAVRQYLLMLDVSRLVMGRAPQTEAKKAMIAATEPDYIVAVREAVERSGAELITTSRLKFLARVDAPWQLQQAMRAVGAIQHPGRVRLNGRKEQVWILRNHEKWSHAGVATVGEYLRTQADVKTTGRAGQAGQAVFKSTATSPSFRKFVYKSARPARPARPPSTRARGTTGRRKRAL